MNHLSKKTVLTYGGLAITTLVVIAAFTTATTYTQLAAAMFSYPLLVYFMLTTLPRGIWRFSAKNPQSRIRSPVMTESVDGAKEHFSISDIDKRMFLKLIGGAGLFLFLYSILNRRGEDIFFKKLPEPGSGTISGKITLEDIAGNKIDPAQNQPVDGYSISDVDEDVVSYYGFMDKEGAWYIMKVDTRTGTFRYTGGNSNLSRNWIRRKNHTYDYFSTVFLNKR